MEKTKPVQTFQLGSVRAAIWVNKGQNGAWCNVTLSRRYWDEKSRVWKDTYSFNLSHVPLLSKTLDQVYTSMYELEAQCSVSEDAGAAGATSGEPSDVGTGDAPTSGPEGATAEYCR